MKFSKIKNFQNIFRQFSNKNCFFFYKFSKKTKSFGHFLADISVKNSEKKSNFYRKKRCFKGIYMWEVSNFREKIRVLEKINSQNWKLWIFKFFSIFRYPTPISQKTGARGAKIFFYTANLSTIPTEFQVNPDDVTDYQWVNREEFWKTVPGTEYKKAAKFAFLE